MPPVSKTVTTIEKALSVVISCLLVGGWGSALVGLVSRGF